jgi:sulfonate transport system substrate-binding protein
MKALTPRRLLALTVPILAATTLAACGSSGTSIKSAAATEATVPTISSTVPPGTTLKVAQQFGAEQLPIQLAGLTTPAAMTIDWSNFTGGPQIVQALEANAIDVGLLGDVPLAYTQVAKKGIVAILAFKASGASSGVVAAPGEHFTSLADLKGKRVAYTQATAPQGFLLQALQAAGLSPSAVHLVNISSQANVTAALIAHSIDAAAFTEPLISTYLNKNPTASVIERSGGISSGLSYLVTTQQALENPAKSAAIGQFVKELVGGDLWENSHEAAWVRAYYVGKEDLPAALGDKVYQLAGPTTFPVIGPAVYAKQQALLSVLSAASFLPTGLNAQGEFDPRYNAIIQAAANPS